MKRILSRSRSHSRPWQQEQEDEKEYKYSRRKSTEIRGEYADVVRAQVEHIETLREQQAKNKITHNVDGLPIPVPVNNDDDNNDNDQRRRSSLSYWISRTRSRSRSASRHSHNRDLEPTSSTSTSECQPEQFRFSRRKSTEILGPYAATLQAQMDHMKKLRTKQEKTIVTHNADGLPIPPPVEQHRSSVTQILGLDKESLSR